MTPKEIIDEMKSDSLLNQVRQLFSFGYAGIEQASLQRRPPGPIEVRAMEFDVARKIINLIETQTR